MDLEYDQKFEEMKKYIPFLESMIKRLESTSASSSNPRQAQLDKIRSLRDLLLNKKKRMKMENLLKCEQVLVNLYAKVEQRDTLSGVKKAPDPGFAIDPPTPQEKSDLEAVRNKLKSVVKRQEEIKETLPEILRHNEVEEVHTAGSKEPALFQRRPNKASLSPNRTTPNKMNEDKVSPQSLASKRNYTRVLVSPETSSRRWSPTESAEDKPLFSRRSPRRSPRRYSPSYHKRERKKSSKDTLSRKSKDLNITLNVPEDSLSTLNTKDIFSRIINCSDGDVDIDTLRELRKQILTELQKTGARDDISDLILKSYSKKNKSKRREEVEEGELSDSESEAIENIYGNLVLKDQNESKSSPDKEKARKIQICLVINSENAESSTKKADELSKASDAAELEMYDKGSKEEIQTDNIKGDIKKSSPGKGDIKDSLNKSDIKNNPGSGNIKSNSNTVETKKQTTKDDKNKQDSEIYIKNEEVQSQIEVNKKSEVINIDEKDDKISKKEKTEDNSSNKDAASGESHRSEVKNPKEIVLFKANFYKPLNENPDSSKLEENKEVKHKEIPTKPETSGLQTSILGKSQCNIESELEKNEHSTEIPLLNEPTMPQKPAQSTVSEIDILQALKNEILSEAITIPVSESSTPLLHQPKVIKVASAKEILPKKRISIEKYKQKAVNSSKLFLDEHASAKDDNFKKTSIRLTEKECERFNIPKIPFDDSSDSDVGEIQACDVYGDLAPKSPDHDESSNIESTPPVIIPVDPVKTVPVNHKADVDMRTLPLLSPNKNNAMTESVIDIKKIDPKIDQSKSQSRPPLLDPRVRREFSSKVNNQSSSPHSGNPERTPRSVYTNVTQSPASNAVMTPNARSYEMTPSHQSFDFDQSNKKHVYVPTFSAFDSRERENSATNETRWEKSEPARERKSRFEDFGDASWSSSDVSQSTRYSDSFTADKYNKGQRNDRYSLDNRDSYLHKRSERSKTPIQSYGRDVPVTSTQTFSRLDKPMTPVHPFGRSDCPNTPSHPFGRSDCPTTPSHPFGRSECSTPSHTFGRSECPPTPSHSFGRSDCPSTPSHPFGSHSFNVNECSVTPSHSFGTAECPPTPTPLFGRNECPQTPNHPFGRSDCPATPSHPFGLLECPRTPSHPFGRSDSNNLYGRPDYNSKKYVKDPRLNRKSDYESNSQFEEKDRGYYKDRNYSNYRGSSYKSQKSYSSSDSYQNQDRDRNSKYRYYAQDQPRREHSVSGSMSKDYENDRLYSRERGRSNTRSFEEVGARCGNQHERSDRCNARSDDSLTRSTSRAPSVGRIALTETEQNTLSVKSHAGRSFTIDTSINSTFQNFLKSGKGMQVFEYNFNTKRERATSVGRSLVQDSNKGRVLSERSNEKPHYENKNNVFRRASSVGRDLITEKRSFQEIKADFENYRFPSKEVNKFDTGKIRNIDTKSKNTIEHISRKKEMNDKPKEGKYMQSTSKLAYSPRKNIRDPRMRREYDSKNKHYDKSFYGDLRSRKSGIIYSNDNIVKGAILTSGYGVKNYKIPKIKRAVEEKEVESPKIEEPLSKNDEKDKDKRKHAEKGKDQSVKEKTNDRDKDKRRDSPKHKETSKETPTVKFKETVIENSDKTVNYTEIEKCQQIDDNNKSYEHTERRLTRSSRKNLDIVESNVITKTKKSKKSIISDTDSDTEKDVADKNKKTDLNISTPELISVVKDKKVCKKPKAFDIDSHFGLDELEMFSDNVASDPVLDNINALIADLDNDLDTSKTASSNNFTKEISLENMMQNISCPQDNGSRQNDEFSKVLQDVEKLSQESDDKIHEISESGLKRENKISGNVVSDNTEVEQDSKNIDNSTTVSPSVSQNFEDLFDKNSQSKSLKNVDNKSIEESTLHNCDRLDKPANEDIVSTTGLEKRIVPGDDKSKIDDRSTDGCSTPDSTINTDDVLEKPQIDAGLADSTNEAQSETNVTSTESIEPKPSSSRTEIAPTLELGSLLSILQDKSKIKELLSMLGDQSDNDKIKKKLERLSEIVSDDEKDEKLEQGKNKTAVFLNEKRANVTCEVHEETSITEDKEEQLNEDNDKNKEHVTSEDIIKEENVKKGDDGLQVMESKKKKKMPVKKTKFSKKGKGRCLKKMSSIAEKRVTRASAAVETTKQKTKKPPRELQKLHDDIKEMFIRDDVLSATGIRMCRLAKLVDERIPSKEETGLNDVEPVVVLEKFKNSIEKNRDIVVPEKSRKKPGPKPKPKILIDSLPETETEDKQIKYKPGPKCKTKNKRESDPYAFETDSVGDTNTEKASDDDSDNSSDSENCSLASSRSFGSSEVLADIKKKPKRKRRGWQDGVIKPKHKKKKVESNKSEPIPETLENSLPSFAIEKQILIPDMNCFTDRNYCFRKNEFSYSCRLCVFIGKDIVLHYKNEHPHVEIPLSRMAPQVAKEAIDQCKEINFQAVSKISSDKYVCIFCFKEFSYKNSVLESFFWHVVSMHTGEYKHSCTECVNESQCPFSLDIPPPPRDIKGQLIGYICKKCNFTQLSLENLKTHVIVRHNDEQTAVYTINLAAMSKKALKDFLRSCDVPELPPRRSLLQDNKAKSPCTERDPAAENSTRVCSVFETAQRKSLKKSNQSATIQSKITFEADDNVSELSDLTSEGPGESTIKIERVEPDVADDISHEPQSSDVSEIDRPSDVDIHQLSQPLSQQDHQSSPTRPLVSDDIMDYPHFKININDVGAKEYICCINGKDNHFKTTLLISMKKHVQLKHCENWDGYCFVCKVIVTPQGAHRFKDCFEHYLDKHMDNFPILQKEITSGSSEKIPDKKIASKEDLSSSKAYINVRPLSELISGSMETIVKESPSFPVIQSVVSLGAQPAETPQPNPTFPLVKQDKKTSQVTFKYEEVQAKVMLKKYCLVLETMMARDKLVQVYKCAGRFCSFTSDSAEKALAHASAHERIGGIDALNCSYCDFDCNGNGIDLVMHVFNEHGHCQYSCSQCFYRAASSQAVGAHMTRIHGVALSGATVLRTTTVASNPHFESNMLTREQAVPYYVCSQMDRDGSCKFRTYTPDKFCEHLQQKHVAATSYSCYMCQIEVPSPAELVQHMKSHGLKLYQCTWCILGADNEAELLAHVSSVHPNKQPQAYLRIITNKEGSNELRVLPLAFLNKQKVLTEDVAPKETTENPATEAQRSIKLETLINQPTNFPGPANEIGTVPEATEPPPEIFPETVSQPVVATEELGHSSLETAMISPAARPNLTIIGPKQINAGNSESKLPLNQLKTNVTNKPPTDKVEPFVVITTVNPPQNVIEAPPVKSEPIETPKTLHGEVVVLDSDDEEPKQPVIDLSDEEASTNAVKKDNMSSKKVPVDVLGTCPKCRQVCKTIQGLKKHMHYCYPNKEQSCKCAHCSYIAPNRDVILNHYMEVHCDRNIYQCGVCHVNLMTLALVRRHLKYVHKEKDLIVTSTLENGIFCYVVNVAPKEKREQQKRKLSTSNTETVVKRRFKPQEIDQLPISPIFDHLVYCEICEFSTKVRLNMVRHLQLHAEQQPVPQTAPVNPVPHLETNEKHFDKMVNLASSSIVNRAPDKASSRNSTENTTHVPIQMPPELAARYPKRVTARERNTCGFIGCTYTSVDEAMLKRHWETLHADSTNFRCVHCPSSQSVDTTKPLTASRVVSHLKMHDETLFACSKCNYYHFKRDFLEKHLTDVHPDGQLMIVRDETGTVAATPPAPMIAAPTMDLKPWQCGFCKFKSMLRPEVVDHCFKIHQSKMQYRCAYCPYRASAVENVNNHLAHSHANEPEDVIYYYYREGSLPDENDGMPRWMKQRQKMGSSVVPEIKTEAERSPVPTPPVSPVTVDLNLVKKELVEEASPVAEESIEDLCKRFGNFCEPNGIKYKCPLCNVVMEDTREAMQSHLFEELKYRKWSCGLCSYKAFHKAGLIEHMTSEHRRQYNHIELPTDTNIEKWVKSQLDYQAAIIDKHKNNLVKQKIITERTNPPPSSFNITPPSIEAVEKFSLAQLEDAFGSFGAPNNMMYCCPKCAMLNKDEAIMRDHLEMELNKIRWGCTNCSNKYQTYHEAQFHCKGHDGPSRPKEAIRDPSMRAAWVSNIIQSQKNAMQNVSVTPSTSEPPKNNDLESDNSLLVVRYVERVPTPDLVTVRRKRPAQDSDDERLVIDEGGPKNKKLRTCPYCDFKTKHHSVSREHILKHYNLKAYTCCYCDYSSYRQGVLIHLEREHPKQPVRLKSTEIPTTPPPNFSPKRIEDGLTKVICLFCEKTMPEQEAGAHTHDNTTPEFAMKGDVVVKCCICLCLRLDVKSLQEHHNIAHPHVPINYALFKLHHDHRETHYCSYCSNVGFKYLRDLKSHHSATHPSLPLKYASTVKHTQQKRCARKSTTKLPGSWLCKSVAKKSTTKLPYSVPSTSDEGYSYYKTKPPSLEEYDNVTTLMSFCNRMMPFTLKKLSEIINIEPKVLVTDIKNSSDDTLN